MARMSMFIIALIVFMMIIVGGFGSLIGSINSNYNTTGYNESDISSYNKLNELTSNVQEIQNKTTSLQSKSGVLDVLGGFFESAYDAIKVSLSSLNVFTSMSNDLFDKIGIDNGQIFKIGLILIVIVVIIIMIILSTVLKRES